MGSPRRQFLRKFALAAVTASGGCSALDAGLSTDQTPCRSRNTQLDGKPLQIISDNVSDYTIVTTPDATQTELFATTELQRYLNEATGAHLPIAQQHTRHSIEVQTGSISVDCSQQASGDAFRIHADGTRLSLTGSTARAVLYAVYDFLERYVGIRWPAPGPDGEYVPKTDTLKVEPISETRTPDFAFRIAGTFQSKRYVDWAVKNKLHVTRWTSADELAKSYADRRGGYLHDTNVHSFYDIVPPNSHGMSNSEYFGTTETGERSSQLDVSLPELADVFAEKAITFFDENPSATMFPITPNDGYGWPTGTSSARYTLAHKQYGHPSKVKHHQLVSDAYFAFVNRVARRVRRHYPRKYIYSLAYVNYVYPPATFRELESNVIVSVAHYAPADYAHPITSKRSGKNREFHNILREWRTVAKNRLVYEYTVKYALDHLPFPIGPRLGKDIKELHELGYTGFYSQGGEGRWGQCGPHFYVMAKLLWDVDRDTEAVLDEYFSAMFGDAAKSARAAYDVLSSKLAEPTVHLNRHPTREAADYLTPKVLTRLKELLAAAKLDAEEDRHRRNVQAMQVPVKYAPHYFAMRNHLSEYRKSGDRRALRNAVAELNAIRELVFRNEDVDAIPREAISRDGYYTLQRYFEPYFNLIDRSGTSWTVISD